jgi:hypothetical protein
MRAVFALLFLLAAAGAWFVLLGPTASAAPSAPPAPKKKNPLATMVDKAVGKDAETALNETTEVVPLPMPEPPPTLDDRTASAAPVAAVPATPAPRPAAATLPSKPPEISDPLMAKRVERRFAKLRDWAAKLEAKKATLKTPFQIEAFNEEAAKYHAELTAAREEAAEAAKSSTPATAAR